MKVRIKRRFRDKDTLQIMKAGLHVDYEPERATQLAGWGFVELLEKVEETEDVPPAEEVEVPSGNPSEEDVALSDISSEGNAATDMTEDGKEEADEPAEHQDEAKKEEVNELLPEKQEINPFPEKAEDAGPKKRGRKPKK